MRQHHRTCRAIAPVALAIGLIAPLADAQTRCGMLGYLDNDTRRISGTGTIMVECGDECFLGSCEDAPWGNFGVASDFGPKSDSSQFRGWKSWDGKPQWNACTLQYYGGPYVNDGSGQKSDGSNTVGRKSLGRSPNYRTCRDWVPEVKTVRDVEMVVYEMDRFLRTSDDKISTLEYGDIDVPLTCTSDWYCRGVSQWYTQESVDSSGLSARVRVEIIAVGY